jgi:hypothetical protein
MGWIADFLNDIVLPGVMICLLAWGIIWTVQEFPSYIVKLETENCILTGKAISRESKYEKRVGCLIKTSNNEWILLSTYRVVN